jgi:HlyD family secretion protein
MGMDKKIKKKSWFQRNIWLTIVGSIVLVFIIYEIAFTDHSSKLNVEVDKITIEEVTSDLFLDYIAVIGTVEPIQTIFLDATVGGSVEEIYVEEGTMVKKGEPILKLQNDKLVLEISNNEAQVERAINDLESMRVTLYNQKISNKNRLNSLYYDILQLKRQYDRNQELFKDEYISKEELDLARENYERNQKEYELLKEKALQDSVFMLSRISSSQKSIERMKINLKLTRDRLEKLLLKSPVNGELATLNPEIGQVISYGDRIGTINILDSYKLRVEIDEHYIARVIRRLNGDCDFSGQMYPAVITKIYPEVVEGRFAVDMEFTKNIPKEIRIGQTSRIRLELGESKQAVLISRGGFYQSTGGQWVFVVDKSGEFAYKKEIKIGRQNPSYYEVLEGLEPGEKVIVSSYDNFGDVDKLMLK